MDGVTHDVGKWDLLIAHPPCTHLAVSGARWFTEGKKPLSLRFEAAIAGSCLSIKQVKEYVGWDIGMNYADMKDLYGWHISNFKLYEDPVRLKDFWAIQPCTHRGDCCTCRRWDAEKLICRGEAFGIERPPQSWYYVEDGR
jgi:hypothetical protein